MSKFEEELIMIKKSSKGKNDLERGEKGGRGRNNSLSFAS